MDYYIDIHLRPDPEFAPPMLMNALFSKLHNALVKSQHRDIGISFPKVRSQGAGLGDLMRLHGSQASLADLMQMCWLSGMHDHIAVTDARPVPDSVQHRTVRRVQAKSSPERLRRRQQRRHQLSEAQARERIPDTVAERLNLPFVAIRSGSTGNAFRVFIEHGALENHAVEGEFSSYGLSPHTTVPWF